MRVKPADPVPPEPLRRRKVNKLSKSIEAETRVPGTGYAHFSVQSKMAVLNGQLARAEQLLLQQGLVEETMEMYQELHKWEQSIAVAEARQHPEVQTLKANYLQWLTETGQEEKAAELKEREGDHVFAVRLFLKGGLPARAAAVVQRYEDREHFQPALLETVATALFEFGMFEKAGLFYEKLNDMSRAMEAYRKGSAFARAVELSRRAFRGRDVVELEELWGDYLVARKNPDAAVNHFTEAGAYLKAIDAAIDCRQWAKAAQIVETLPPVDAKPYLHKIAKHFEATRSCEEAERFYLRAGTPQDAVEMYSKAGKWEVAHRIATEHMTQAEVAMFYMTQAHRLEAAGKLREAERLYVMVHEPDLAINMYKKARRYDDMIRLVTSFRKDLLHETHLHLAQQLEAEGSFKLAERHFVEATDWGAAVNMYRANELWDEAVRVAKQHGGVHASKKVAYAWAVSLGGEAGAKLLAKFGLIDQAIEYATESGNFDHAFALAQASKQDKVPEVHLKYAMFLEDEGQFESAEKEFLKAEKPKEAIDMYTHQQDWAAALRVAETSEPSSVPDVLCAQAKALVEKGDFTKAEALFVRAKKPELAVEAYKHAARWGDAQRLAKEFLPHKVADLTAEHAAYMRGDGVHASEEALLGPARSLEEGRDFARAIDAYLKVTRAGALPRYLRGGVGEGGAASDEPRAGAHRRGRQHGLEAPDGHRPAPAGGGAVRRYRPAPRGGRHLHGGQPLGPGPLAGALCDAAVCKGGRGAVQGAPQRGGRSGRPGAGRQRLRGPRGVRAARRVGARARAREAAGPTDAGQVRDAARRRAHWAARVRPRGYADWQVRRFRTACPPRDV